MYCSQCGKENKAGTNFCVYCGARLNIDNVEAEKSQQKAKTYYEILEITQDASLEIIKAAYKVMVKKYHPDNNENGGDGNAIMEVNLAYEILSDPEKRRKYDEQLKLENQRAEEVKFSNTEKQWENYAQPNSGTQQSYEVQPSSDDKEDGYWAIIGFAIGSLVSGILFRIVRRTVFKRWIIIIVGLIFAILIGELIASIIIAFMKKSSNLKLSRWARIEHEKVETLVGSICIALMLFYLGITNWIWWFVIISTICSLLGVLKSLLEELI